MEPLPPPITMIRTVMSKTSWLDETRLPVDLIAGEEKFQSLWELHPLEQHKIRMYGKLIDTPRFQQAYLRTYKFSGTQSNALPLPELFAPYFAWANNLGYGNFNAVLVNWYADGSNHIGSHSDDERQLIENSPVATITLCQPSAADKKGFTAKLTLRKFRIRDKESNEIVKDILTSNGSVLIMGGRFQKKFKHEIVKIGGESAKKVGPRISITLRQFEEEKGDALKIGACASCLGEAHFGDHDDIGADCLLEKLYFCDAGCWYTYYNTYDHVV